MGKKGGWRFSFISSCCTSDSSHDNDNRKPSEILDEQPRCKHCDRYAVKNIENGLGLCERCAQLEHNMRWWKDTRRG